MELRLPWGGGLETVVYIVGPGNPNCLGPAPLDLLVAQIGGSTGPSGPNDE